MEAVIGLRSARALWMTVLTLCGTLPALTAPAQAQEQRVGTVLGLPLAELDRFVEANTFPTVDRFGRLAPLNQVQALHVSSKAGRGFDTSIVTVAVTPTDPFQPAGRVAFPVQSNSEISPLYRQINANDSFSNQVLIQIGDTAVMQMDVAQRDPGKFDPRDTRFMLLPADRVLALQAANPSAKLRTVHLQRTAIGHTDLDVELLAIDPTSASEIRILGEELASTILALNTNVAVQSVLGSGVSAITTVAVKEYVATR